MKPSKKIRRYRKDASSKFYPPIKVGKSSRDDVDPYGSGWYNPTNAFGYETDPNFSTHFRPRADLSHTALFYLYESNPLVRRYIDLWKGDATRKGFELVDKDNADRANQIKKDLGKRFNILGVLSKGVGIERLFGGGIIYADIDDGRPPEDPLNENGIKRILSFRAIEREYCHPHTYDELTGTDTPGEPIHYRIQLMSGTKSEMLIVHKSRLIRLPDMRGDNSLSQISKQRRFTWPVSPVQVAYDSVKRYGVGNQAFSQHLQNLVVDVFKVSDLSSISDPAKFRDYIRNQWLLKNSMRANVLGSEDSLERSGTPLTGIEAIIDAIYKDITMAFGTPLSILFSNESGGLGGSTITGDRLVWFDQVKSYQKTQLVPVMERVLELYGFEQKLDIGNTTVVFNDLHETSELEKLTNRKLAFESDTLLTDMGFPATEIFESRFSGDEVDLNSFNYDQKTIEEYIDDKEQQQRDIAEQATEPDDKEDNGEQEEDSEGGPKKP